MINKKKYFFCKTYKNGKPHIIRTKANRRKKGH